MFETLDYFYTWNEEETLDTIRGRLIDYHDVVGLLAICAIAVF